jgi:hypothetical protein
MVTTAAAAADVSVRTQDLFLFAMLEQDIRHALRNGKGATPRPIVQHLPVKKNAKRIVQAQGLTPKGAQKNMFSAN